jgi:hypothetical protein
MKHTLLHDGELWVLVCDETLVSEQESLAPRLNHLLEAKITVEVTLPYNIMLIMLYAHDFHETLLRGQKVESCEGR